MNPDYSWADFPREDGFNTRVEVEYGAGAKDKIRFLVLDFDAMLTRCFWRFVGQKIEHGQVSGDIIRFTMSKEDAEQLVHDLLEIDSRLKEK